MNRMFISRGARRFISKLTGAFAAFDFHLGVQHRVVVGGHGEFLNRLPPVLTVIIHKLTNIKFPFPCWVFSDEGMRPL